jgi:acyl-coenzyme A synthetase/AMP-(fatty) acid ligase
VLSVFTCPVWTGAGYKSPASVWSVGGTVVIDPTTPFGTLRQANLTHAVLTPMILRAILALPADAFPRNERLQLHYAGGTLSWAEIEEAKRRITPHIINGLGATETGAFGMTPVEAPEDLRWHRLFPEVEVQLVDDDDQPVPTGAVGRVRVSTAGGPKGYLNDNEATATFFRDGYFYPGDLGVLREDGRLALQGRVTEVINIDGVKISPAPIEDRLRDAIGAPVIVLTLQNDAGEEELHVAIETTVAVTAHSLSQALWAEFRQVPRVHVHALSAFPRNAMGKVNRPQLAAQIGAANRPTRARPQS